MHPDDRLDLSRLRILTSGLGLMRYCIWWGVVGYGRVLQRGSDDGTVALRALTGIR